MTQEVKFYQTGTFTVGNRLLAPEQTHRPGLDRAKQFAQLRPSRLPGLRRGARRALCHRRGDAGHRQPVDRGERDRLPRGVLDAVPRIVVAAALDPFAVRQHRRRRHRHRRGPAGEGPRPRARHRAGRRRRHDRHRLRLPVGHVRAQRRRALHLLRQRGLHEHRRAALGRDAAGGPHRDHQAGGKGARERVRAGQERAANRDGARDPVRRDGDRRRSARPRGQGRARDDAARCALSAHPRALPARLGLGEPRHDPARAPGQARPASSRCSRPSTARSCERVQDPPPRAGRGVPPAAETLRPSVRAKGRPDMLARIQADADRNISRFGLLDEEATA